MPMPCHARLITHQMMQNLGVAMGDIIKIVSVRLEKGQQIKLQPSSVDFLDISDPRAV